MTLYVDAQQKQRILQRGYGTVTESGGGACWVKFEQVAKEIPSQTGGTPTYEDVIMAYVHIPGGDVFPREMDKSGEEWLRRKHGRFFPVYEQFKAGKEQKVAGTPITVLNFLSPARVKSLEARNIFTVEQLASLSDAHVQDLGMGAREIQKKAKSYLEDSSQSDKEMKAIKENEALKSRLEELEKKLADVAIKEEVEKASQKDAKKKKE